MDQLGSSIAKAKKPLAGVATLLVLIQAFLAGRHVNALSSNIEVHGYIGNAVFLIAVVLLVGALFNKNRRDIIVAALFVVLTTSQIGLGYLGREGAEAAAIHVPLGLVTFGFCLSILHADNEEEPQASA